MVGLYLIDCDFNKFQQMQKCMFAPVITLQGLQYTVVHPRNCSLIGVYGIHPKGTSLIKTTSCDLSRRRRTCFITVSAPDIIILRYI